MIQNPGAPCRKALDQLEARARSLRDQIGQTDSAMYPLDESFAAITRGLDRSSQQHSVISRLSAYASGFNLSRVDASRALKEPLTLTDLYAIFGPKILEQLKSALQAAFGDRETGLPKAEREVKLAQLKGELRQVEIEAERERMRLEGEGYTVLRPDTADVAVLFEVWASVDAADQQTRAPARSGAR